MGGTQGRTVTIGDHEYQPLKPIAQGEFSEVWLVQQLRTGTLFALKRMEVQPDDRERHEIALWEYQINKILPRHKNLVHCEGATRGIPKGSNATQYLLLFEYCSGGTLVDYVSGTTKRPLSEILNYFLQVCTAVQVLHSQKPPIIHRDIKPDNVLLHKSGVWKLGDFGSSTNVVFQLKTPEERLRLERILESRTVLSYRAPEMIDMYRGEVGTKADIWSLGCLFYNLLYGTLPFPDGKLAITNGTYQTPPPMYTYNLQVLALLDRMLTVKSSARADIAEVIHLGGILLKACSGTVAPSKLQLDLTGFVQTARAAGERESPLDAAERGRRGSLTTGNGQTTPKELKEAPGSGRRLSSPGGQPGQPAGPPADSARSPPSASPGPVARGPLATTSPPPARSGSGASGTFVAASAAAYQHKIKEQQQSMVPQRTTSGSSTAAPGKAVGTAAAGARPGSGSAAGPGKSAATTPTASASPTAPISHYTVKQSSEPLTPPQQQADGKLEKIHISLPKAAHAHSTRPDHSRQPSGGSGSYPAAYVPAKHPIVVAPPKKNKDGKDEKRRTLDAPIKQMERRESGSERVDEEHIRVLNVALAVAKATSDDMTLPNAKHVRRLIQASWKREDDGKGAPAPLPVVSVDGEISSSTPLAFTWTGLPDLFPAVQQRPINTDPTVAFKSLQALHKLLQAGSPALISQSNTNRAVFARMHQVWQEFSVVSAKSPAADLIAPYAAFLHKRISFLVKAGWFEGNFSLDWHFQRLQTQASWPAGWKMDVTQFARMVAELLTLTGDLLFLGELVMSSKSTAPIRGNQAAVEFRESLLVPVIEDLRGLFLAAAFLLTQLCQYVGLDSNTLSRLRQRYADSSLAEGEVPKIGGGGDGADEGDEQKAHGRKLVELVRSMQGFTDRMHRFFAAAAKTSVAEAISRMTVLPDKINVCRPVPSSAFPVVSNIPQLKDEHSQLCMRFQEQVLSKSGSVVITFGSGKGSSRGSSGKNSRTGSNKGGAAAGNSGHLPEEELDLSSPSGSIDLSALAHYLSVADRKDFDAVMGTKPAGAHAPAAGEYGALEGKKNPPSGDGDTWDVDWSAYSETTPTAAANSKPLEFSDTSFNFDNFPVMDSHSRPSPVPVTSPQSPPPGASKQMGFKGEATQVAASAAAERERAAAASPVQGAVTPAAAKSPTAPSSFDVFKDFDKAFADAPPRPTPPATSIKTSKPEPSPTLAAPMTAIPRPRSPEPPRPAAINTQAVSPPPAISPAQSLDSTLATMEIAVIPPVETVPESPHVDAEEDFDPLRAKTSVMRDAPKSVPAEPNRRSPEPGPPQAVGVGMPVGVGVMGMTRTTRPGMMPPGPVPFVPMAMPPMYPHGPPHPGPPMHPMVAHPMHLVPSPMGGYTGHTVAAMAPGMAGHMIPVGAPGGPPIMPAAPPPDYGYSGNPFQQAEAYGTVKRPGPAAPTPTPTPAVVVSPTAPPAPESNMTPKTAIPRMKTSREDKEAEERERAEREKEKEKEKEKAERERKEREAKEKEAEERKRPEPPRADDEIDYSELVMERRIGLGAFAEVFAGKWRGTDVAIKKLHMHQFTNQDLINEFASEVAMLRKLRHPNIILFMGACTKPPTLCLVTELMTCSLFDLLHNTDVQLSWKLRLQIAMDTARGMNFLHFCVPPIIHRDLKSPNVLLDSTRRAKVCDFGLARSKAITTMTGQCGTFQWMAPEVIANGKYTEKADVFSFGVILWELISRELPYDGMNSVQVSVAVLTKGYRPPIPKNCPPDYARLIEECWHQQPEKRPSFDSICERLTAFMKSKEAVKLDKTSHAIAAPPPALPSPAERS